MKCAPLLAAAAAAAALQCALAAAQQWRPSWEQLAAARLHQGATRANHSGIQSALEANDVLTNHSGSPATEQADVPAQSVDGDAPRGAAAQRGTNATVPHRGGSTGAGMKSDEDLSQMAGSTVVHDDSVQGAQVLRVATSAGYAPGNSSAPANATAAALGAGAPKPVLRAADAVVRHSDASRNGGEAAEAHPTHEATATATSFAAIAPAPARMRCVGATINDRACRFRGVAYDLSSAVWVVYGDAPTGFALEDDSTGRPASNASAPALDSDGEGRHDAVPFLQLGTCARALALLAACARQTASGGAAQPC